MPPRPLLNFEIKKYSQSESKLNGVYSRNNLPKIKDGTYLINLDEFKSIWTHWIAWYNNYNVNYFVSFGGEHISQEIKKFIGNKNIITNAYRIQGYDLIMSGFFCIGFIDFMLKSLFSANDYENSDKIILKYFQ